MKLFLNITLSILTAVPVIIISNLIFDMDKHYGLFTIGCVIGAFINGLFTIPFLYKIMDKYIK